MGFGKISKGHLKTCQNRTQEISEAKLRKQRTFSKDYKLYNITLQQTAVVTKGKQDSSEVVRPYIMKLTQSFHDFHNDFLIRYYVKLFTNSMDYFLSSIIQFDMTNIKLVKAFLSSEKAAFISCTWRSCK